LRSEVIEETAGRAADEGESALGHHAGFDEDLHHAIGHERGRRGRLRDDGHAREERGGRFFREAPAREVERIDVNGDAFAREPHVLAKEPCAASELDPVAVGEDETVAELRREIGVRRERPDRAVDVELRVAARVAAVRDGEADELVTLRVDRPRHRAEHLAALHEIHRAEARAAFRARELERGREVEPVGRRGGDDFLGGRIHELGLLAAALLPRTRNEARELVHAGDISLGDPGLKRRARIGPVRFRKRTHPRPGYE
jgi:hypothetical protein